MASLKELFDLDFRRDDLKTHQTVCLGSNFDQDEPEVILRAHFHFDSNARYFSCFIPKTENTALRCSYLLSETNWMQPLIESLRFELSHPGETARTSSEMFFSGRVYFYTEHELSNEEQRELLVSAQTQKLDPVFRSQTYAIARSKASRPLVFVSHDSRDKDAIVRPLADELLKLVFPVWYDEFTLRPGSNLRASIESGIQECRFCVIVLTQNFLSNKGWTRVEFDAVFTKEVLERGNVIIPVWCDVSTRDIYEYSPNLANITAINWNLGVTKVASRIANIVNTTT
ncbi:MAG: toll/interleukin-1 receptor domain-containing protein [Chloroflexi bacterium]|nr:toll/interleukin-1 receptor domain-containing protein [Chloroflexota bacterium]